MQTLETLTHVLSNIEYKNVNFRCENMGKEGYFLQVTFEAPDAYTGIQTVQRGRKWYVSCHSTDSEIVQTAFAAVLMAEEHEIRESFQFNGQPIFGPHFNSYKLADFAQQGEEVHDARQHLFL